MAATSRDLPEPFVEEAVERLLAGEAETPDDVQQLKLDLCSEHPVEEVPSNADILDHCSEEEREALAPLLRTNRTRSLSGVAVVTVQSSPWRCPHGTCTFCPGGPEWGTAQSYTGEEPAALRAERHDFDARDQAADRLESLEDTGHPVDKVEVIVQGGTFPARPVGYQEDFVKGIFQALNGHGRPDREPAETLEEAHARNEADAEARCVGLTIETKPDWARPVNVDRCKRMGATRLELGVQSLHDEHLEATNRGHTVQDGIEATRTVRDAGLKVTYHLMPGLPGSTYEQDLETFRRTFEDPAFRPDKLKIYPTLVVPDTELYEQWQAGEFEPRSEGYCVDLLSEIKADVIPPWVRIQRIERDIPTFMVDGGVQKTNLRQLVRKRLDEEGERCRCIRCREAGHRRRRDGVTTDPESVRLTETGYEAAGGTERFLAYEDPDRDVLVAYLRVREPPEAAYDLENREQLAYPDALEGAAIVRELRTVGVEVPLAADGGPEPAAWQHQGYGRDLMDRAEELARQGGWDRLAVTAGVGVKEYYRSKLGYEDAGPYVATDL
jgi:elongator complex protein 3